MVLNTIDVTSSLAYEKFIKIHKAQLNLIPKHFWKTLYEKISLNVFDAHKYIAIDEKKVTFRSQVIKETTAKVINPEGIKADNPKNIFIIRHLLHYHVSEGREMFKQLINNRDPLVGYLKNLMNIKDDNVCLLLDKLLNESWKYIIPFTIKTKGNRKSLPVWTITDEVGMNLRHSFDPNCVMLTFQYMNFKSIYSVVFPIKNILPGEILTRDYTSFEKITDNEIESNAKDQEEHLKLVYLNSKKKNIKDLMSWEFEDEIDLLRKTLVLPWFNQNIVYYFKNEINFQQHEPTIIEFYEKRIFKEPHCLIKQHPIDLKEKISSLKVIKIYCDDKKVIPYITDPRFELVNDQNVADIWWFKNYFSDFSLINQESSNVLVNHFPLGHILNEKDMFSTVCRRKIKKYNGNIDPVHLNSLPEWLPTTFNLNTELIKFVSYFCKRRQRKLDNYWIIKPANLKRASDIFITDNLSAIIRLRSCRNRIASKYIHRPLLFYRHDLGIEVKFELRYFIILTSVLPLKLYCYNEFQIDFANRPFELKKTYNQETHLTDMRIFKDQVNICYMTNADFIRSFDYQYQYRNFNFKMMNELTMNAIKEMFERATEKLPFGAINHNPASSALYQVDVIISWPNVNSLNSLQPMIVDCNLNPNCEKICKFNKNFYNDALKLMFLKDDSISNFRLL